MLKKTSGLSYNEVRERYEHFRARCAKPYDEYEKEREKIIKNGMLEKGCTEPLYGEKSKCIMQIVPDTKKCETLTIDKKCIKQRIDDSIFTPSRKS
jgi:hypothetical protein